MNSQVAITVPEPIRIAIEGGIGQPDMSRWALEALVLEAVREGLLTRGRGGEILGLGFYDREALYAKRGVTYELSMEELEREQRDMARVFGS